MFKSLVFLVAAIAVSLVYLPGFWVNLLVLVDYYTPWVLMESPMYLKYHEFLISRLEERPEIPLPEIPASEATRENIMKLTKGFTYPLVIRGLLGNSPAVQTWHDSKWWTEHYANEEVLCGTLFEVVENCTIGLFFEELEKGNPFYISGASVIFDENPELQTMVDNQLIRDIEPGYKISTQIFMGVPTMGSDIHAAIGVNIFRQVTGQKKWWFIPPSQTPFLMPSINVNGISAHTKTFVGKQGGTPSPWLNKLERYTSVVSPGDVLINPPWFWHGILNLGENKNDLIIGTPSRYGGTDTFRSALGSNVLFSLNAMIRILSLYGLKIRDPNFKPELQKNIADNRRDRDRQLLEE